MRAVQFADLSDEALFAEVTRRRSAGEDYRAPLGELCLRWKDPAVTVVRRVQASYLRGSPEDALDLFQEAVGKFIDRGLEQFRGLSEQMPGKAASPKTFFLRIVKHAAIDRYRRAREQLDDTRPGEEDAPEHSAAEASRAMVASQQREDAAEAKEVYWSAFERLRKEHPNEAAAWDLYHHQDVDDHGECARMLGITVANSYKRVSRAQAFMKLYLLELRDEEQTP